MSLRRLSTHLVGVEEGLGGANTKDESELPDHLLDDHLLSSHAGDAHGLVGAFPEVGRVDVDHTANDPEDPLYAHDRKAKEQPSTSDVTGWDYVYKRLQIYDREMIKGYSEDIDSLLIFAGLFSAVLTAFLVEVYTQLQPDNTQLSVQLLSNISFQLQQISLNQAAPASSNLLDMSFQADAHVVAINTLWFLSLVLALASALLGIFVKQWLREYMSWINISPVQHAIQLRDFRYEAFQRWKVPAIVTLVPGLLQVAVVLFFGGLVALLWPIDTIVSATPFGWTILPILRPFYRLIKGPMNSLYFYDWPDSLKTVENLCRRYGSLHADMYAFDRWDHRDLSLRRFGRDIESRIAYQIHSLLWLASHEEPGDGVIAQCISDTPGPRVRTRSALESKDPSAVVQSSLSTQRLRGYWKAIAKLYDMPCDGTTIPLFDTPYRGWVYDEAKESFETHNSLLGNFKPTASFNDTQDLLIFDMIKSGLERLMNPSTSDPDPDLVSYYIKSLIGMSLITKNSQVIRALYPKLLLDNIANLSRSSSIAAADKKKICAAIQRCAVKMDSNFRPNAKDMADTLDIFLSLYDRETLRSSPLQCRCFWAAVTCITNTGVLARGEHKRSTEAFQRWRTVMQAFGECLMDALSLWTEPGNEAHVAKEDLRVDWPLLVLFLGFHRDTVLEFSIKVTTSILNAAARGTLGDQAGIILLSFITASSAWGASWHNVKDIYKYFGFRFTRRRSGVAGLRLVPPKGILSHTNSGEETDSKPRLDVAVISEIVSDNDGRDGMQSDPHTMHTSQEVPTSRTLKARETGSQPTSVQKLGSEGGQVNDSDDHSLPRGGHNLLKDAEITSIRSASSSLAGGDSGQPDLGRRRTSERSAPAIDGQNVEDTLDRSSAYDRVPSLGQDRPPPRAESQDGGGGRAGATNSVLIRTGVEHDRADNAGVGDVNGTESSPGAEDR
ncbi:hypothetical protein PUNSTDRAFT_133564 [Punctularia strigosozonata HHB-11173 SS5]|uniref:uncharacterized protein n=1 Tax=Punctularia strigosozonata (strain HHB-11173) TaxID=741275 RepID=UPI00044166DC|nr:uncharacterized protein PUNSTDRAFT_133564 [Punctularia strigosozonata HHB-11173 SS5]EIN09794.1 hypothetical protein PUNSTDRAFT_133564 [Punctularia strigosozonata HHB-11173 SS5]